MFVCYGHYIHYKLKLCYTPMYSGFVDNSPLFIISCVVIELVQIHKSVNCIKVQCINYS